MLLQALLVVAGLVLLPLGAWALVRGSTGLALRMGISALAIGLTVVAFGTGGPELVLGVRAASTGNTGIALGNVVGSNISNIALVLGLAALVKPMKVRSELVRREIPVMIAVTLVLCALLIDKELSRFEGLVLVSGAFVYLIAVYRAAKRSRAKPSVDRQFDQAYVPTRSLWLDLLLTSAGLVALLIGAQLLLDGAVFFATALGVNQVVIGLTVVAVGTSLPELATSVTSTVRNEADVAFGNAVGSNIFNILVVLGAVALVSPLRIEGLRAADLVVLVSSAVVLLLIMRRGWVLNRWEGAALLGAYALYMYFVMTSGRV
jgi:cation:H+ antiporter